MARCMIIQADLQTSFWAEAIMTTNYIRNRCPAVSLASKTPYEISHNRIPNLKHFKIFVLDKSQKGKLSHRSSEGIFIGYSEKAKAYRIWFNKHRKIIVF